LLLHSSSSWEYSLHLYFQAYMSLMIRDMLQAKKL
jgi:hypothetical protein